MNLQEALKWLAEVFEDAPDRIKPDTERKDIAGWDSLGTLSLIAALDEKFDIHLSEDQIEGLQNIGDVLEILRGQGALDAA
jgi:acyl carrier protein